MNVLTNFKRQVAGFSRTTKAVAVAAVLLSVTAAGVSSVHSNAVSADACSNNDIIRCGATTPADFVAKANANTTGDLATIYSHSDYGLTPDKYGRFASTAKEGMSNMDGTIVVDGMTVATNTSSIGRTKFSYSENKVIGGKTYYQSKTKQVQNSNMPVMVMFNDKGEMESAVLEACANPIHGEKVTPKYSCDMLNKQAVPGKLNTYQFSTRATATNNASIAKVVYEFGDGAVVEKTNPAEVVEHTYTTAGTKTAKVTVYVNVPGSQQAVSGAACATQIEVKIPYFECVQLVGAILNKDQYEYSFTANLRYGNGASFKSASFNYGDGNTANNLPLSADAKSVTANHKYAQAGNYDITATIVWNDGVKDQSVNCTAKVSPEKPPVSECKPGVPVGSPECEPCPYDSNLPKNSDKCVPPVTELPHTGAGSTIALFSGASLLGGLAHFFLKRRNLAQV